ncbi:predicted protein [Naegleria gruberi]|uniref:Predicted protein n=1 Tax=Naegleria gruberi TaxID=5762 RepID=D2VJR3_NAEGR|nr:uncharacterized protein NAEGRDRAFT_50114 [Naegleria gruberi]EFC43078.1 predicted protein [Naegleria gruberi]|eukprot:XP_002675822.1 predicted protein [Naegleria gruberi strain NEG-M]
MGYSENLGELVKQLVEKKDAYQRNLLYRVIENGKKGSDKEYYERVLIKILDFLVNGKSLLEEDMTQQTNLLTWVTQNSIPFHKYPISELEKGKYYGFLSAYITNAESRPQVSYESDEYLSFTEPTPFIITVENERESKESLLLNRERESEFVQIKEFGKTGSQGKVFIFYHIQSKRLFVFKFYKFDDSGLSTTKFDEVSSNIMRTKKSLLFKQFKMMEKCRYHPNIVTCISLVKSKTKLKDCDPECLVMEYMNGGTLRDEIEIFHEKLIFDYSPSKFAIHLLSLISDVTIHIMNAFIHIHERHSMIHRDIKPENILFHFTNDLKYYVLGDFGLARIVDAQFSTSYGNGTPRYQSPSVLNHHYGKEVDFWSLGCTLIEVILNPLTTIHNYRESRDEILRLLKEKCEYYDNCLACVENFEHFKPFSMFFKLIKKMVDEKLSTTLTATNILLENPFLVKANLLTLNYFGQNFPLIIEEKDIYESMKERFRDLDIPFNEVITTNNAESSSIIMEEIDEVEQLRREHAKMKKMLEQLGLKF